MDQDPRAQGEGGWGQPESTAPGWSPEHGGARLLSDAGGFGKRRCSPDDHGVEAKQMPASGGRGESWFRRNGSPEWLLRLGLVGEKRSNTCRARAQASSVSGDSARRGEVNQASREGNGSPERKKSAMERGGGREVRRRNAAAWRRDTMGEQRGNGAGELRSEERRVGKECRL